MKAYDIMLDHEKDLLLKNGDLVIDESDSQHIEHILLAAPGHYKMSPLVGCDITSRMKGNIDGRYKAKVALQLTADGYKVNRITIEQGILTIDADR